MPPYVPPGTALRVQKLRASGALSYAWQGEVLLCDDKRLVLRAPFNVPLVDLGFTTFRQGDVFVETYYWHRWYNIFEINAGDGTFKGWYCNVGAPPILDAVDGQLSYVDLELDVWANPDRTFQVLDEPEYAAILADESIDPSVRAGAAAGREALLAVAQAQSLPRWPGA